MAVTDPATGNAGVGSTFFEGLVDRMGDLMGDAAGHAAFHFAAYTEGERMAAGFSDTDLDKVLERIDAVLGHRSELLETGKDVRIRVRGSRLLEANAGILNGIALGTLEGALSKLRGRRHVATLEHNHEGAIVTLREDGDD